jgi:hypothetical protein
MTEESFCEVAWEAVASRITELVDVLTRTADLPATADQALAVSAALRDLDEARSWFGLWQAHRLAATGWPGA